MLEKIWNALKDEGVYITTMRNDWNYGNAIVPNSAEKERFIEKTVRSAERKISIVKSKSCCIKVYREDEVISNS